MPSIQLIPRQAAAQCEWFTNFGVEFPGVFAVLGFSVPEKDVIVSETAWAVYSCRMAADATSQAEAWAEWRDRLLNDPAAPDAGPTPGSLTPTVPAGVPPPPGVMSRFRGYIRRIKASPNYTNSIGESLRIVAASATVDEASAKPEISVEPLANFKTKVRVGKRGFSAVILEARREGEADWTSFGVRTAPVFVDDRPTAQPNRPEVVNYRAILARNDQPVGQWSDVVSVTKQP